MWSDLKAVTDDRNKDNKIKCQAELYIPLAFSLIQIYGIDLAW